MGRLSFRIILVLSLACACFSQTNETVSGETGKVGKVVSSVTGNMSNLMDGAWKDVGLFGLGFISKIVMGGLLWFVLGGLLGFLLYLVLKKLKVTQLDFKWYKYIGWIWAPLCILSLACGAGWGGMWRGGEKAVEKAVVKDGVIRKVIANVYTAVAMDGSDYDANGDETSEQIVALFEDSPELMAEAQEELGDKIQGMYETQMERHKMSMWQRFLVRAVAQSGFEDKILGDYGDDAKVLFSTLYLYTKDRNAYDAYLAENPGLAPMGMAIGKAITHAEKESTRWVRATAKFNWISGWIVGLGIPLGLAALFKLLCVLVGRAKDKVMPEDDETPTSGAVAEATDTAVSEPPVDADTDSDGS